ncbi:MAG: hypothetical protein IJQ85_08100 [Selenomonadaceae bacterium]|nr:hypothetical protein [Selenomonadaceae bacterium]
MELYKKPIIATKNSLNGIIPVLSPVFISPIAPVAAVAAAILSKKGNSVIDSAHTSTLATRKDFSLA